MEPSNLNDVGGMRLAIETARTGVRSAQSPFGAAVLRSGELIAAAHNTVWRDCDPTCHAEINAIRRSAAALKSIDLSGCVMYSTCEPCPMCLAAIHWAKIDRVVFGATIADAGAAGFGELHVDAGALARMGGSRLIVERGPCRDECIELFGFWKSLGLCGSY